MEGGRSRKLLDLFTLLLLLWSLDLRIFNNLEREGEREGERGRQDSYVLQTQDMYGVFGRTHGSQNMIRYKSFYSMIHIQFPHLFTFSYT